MKVDEDLTYDVVGIGRAYIDVIGHAPLSLLEKYGIPLGTGRYFEVEDIQDILAQLEGRTICPGGVTPNTLAGLAALGAKVGIFGKVAKDPSGEVYLKDLADRGIVSVCSPVGVGAPLSGTCVVLLTEGGERSFALNSGCADDYTWDDFESFDFATSRYFLVYTKFLTDAVSVDVIARAIKKAAATPCQIVFSLSEVRDWSQCLDQLHGVVLPHASILIGNEAENEAFLNAAGSRYDGTTLLVTTLGARGAKAEQAGAVVNVPACANVEAVSSLGAGDQFLAGFLQARGAGKSLPESLELATRCAAEIMGTIEARPSVDADWRGLV